MPIIQPSGNSALRFSDNPTVPSNPSITLTQHSGTQDDLKLYLDLNKYLENGVAKGAKSLTEIQHDIFGIFTTYKNDQNENLVNAPKITKGRNLTKYVAKSAHKNYNLLTKIGDKLNQNSRISDQRDVNTAVGNFFNLQNESSFEEQCENVIEDIASKIKDQLNIPEAVLTKPEEMTKIDKEEMTKIDKKVHTLARTLFEKEAAANNDLSLENQYRNFEQECNDTIKDLKKSGITELNLGSFDDLISMTKESIKEEAYGVVDLLLDYQRTKNNRALAKAAFKISLMITSSATGGIGGIAAGALGLGAMASSAAIQAGAGLGSAAVESGLDFLIETIIDNIVEESSKPIDDEIKSKGNNVIDYIAKKITGYEEKVMDALMQTMFMQLGDIYLSVMDAKENITDVYADIDDGSMLNDNWKENTEAEEYLKVNLDISRLIFMKQDMNKKSKNILMTEIQAKEYKSQGAELDKRIEDKRLEKQELSKKMGSNKNQIKSDMNKQFMSAVKNGLKLGTPKTKQEEQNFKNLESFFQTMSDILKDDLTSYAIKAGDIRDTKLKAGT